MKPERAAAEESEARCYAVLIRSALKTTDWAALNRAIIARWSESALLRVKRRAWQLVEGGG